LFIVALKVRLNKFGIELKFLKTVDINVASLHGGKIEIHTDKINGPLLAIVNISTSAEGDVFKTISTPAKKLTGVHDLFFVFRGEKELFYFDWWQFNK
jgi:arabinoxylan arabinofuranohydrolase